MMLFTVHEYLDFKRQDIISYYAPIGINQCEHN